MARARKLTEARQAINEAMEHFVSVLLEGAWDVEGEHAHLDVIALAYVTDGQGMDTHARESMRAGWIADGRAPSTATVRKLKRDDSFAANLVGKVIATGIEDDLLVLVWHWTEAERDPDDELEALAGLDALAKLARACRPKLRGRLLALIETALDEMDLVDIAVGLHLRGLAPVVEVPPGMRRAAERLVRGGEMLSGGEGLIKLNTWDQAPAEGWGG